MNIVDQNIRTSIEQFKAGLISFRELWEVAESYKAKIEHVSNGNMRMVNKHWVVTF